MKIKLAVVSFLVIAAACFVGVYIGHGSSGHRKVYDFRRTVKHSMPPLRTAVPGVRLNGKLVPTSDPDLDFVELTVANDTNQPIIAVEIIGSPFVADTGSASSQAMPLDARTASGEYQFQPEKPLIPPHGTYTFQSDYQGVPDDGNLTLSSVLFADGHYEGEHFGIGVLQGYRAHHAEEHGHPEEERARKAQGGHNN
jgi:hypothetical protein